MLFDGIPETGARILSPRVGVAPAIPNRPIPTPRTTIRFLPFPSLPSWEGMNRGLIDRVGLHGFQVNDVVRVVCIHSPHCAFV